MTIPGINPNIGYGPTREQPAVLSRGWSETIAAQLPNPTGALLVASPPRRVMQHTSAIPGILQLQFLGEEGPPLSPAVEVEITQGVDTGRIIWRVYVGRVGVAVPVSAGLIYADVVRTRGLAGQFSAQLRAGIASDMALSVYERVPALSSVGIPLPLGSSRWEVELGPGATVTVATGKSSTALVGPISASGILSNDAVFLLTNTGGAATDVLCRFLGNC